MAGNKTEFMKRFNYWIDRTGVELDPVLILMECAAGRDMLTGDTIPLKQEDRMKAAMELCSYMYPKRKAIEISGDEGNPIVFKIEYDGSPAPSVEASANTDILGTKIIDGNLLLAEQSQNQSAESHVDPPKDGIDPQTNPKSQLAGAIAEISAGGFVS